MRILTPVDQQEAERRMIEIEQAHGIKISAGAHAEALSYLFSFSEFIFSTCLKYRQVLEALLEHLNQQEQPQISMPIAHLTSVDEVAAKRRIRLHRHQVMVLLAADDFLQRRSIQSTMALLSQMADELYGVARAWAIEDLSERFGYATNKQGEEVALIALGMGKLGGFELNFSSDIDLIFCYAQKGQTQGGRKSEDFQLYFTKLAQKIIQLLDEVTGDGQVFRVDMRLRPFGESGPLVSSFSAIEDYYQNQGREWERYALLKARPLVSKAMTSAVELQQHKALQKSLKPFVFRRYIDFSVIDSLRTMKRQIQSEVKRRQIRNNIKLGSGGIREVEFTVQAMQMLRGGKERQLQSASLLTTLPELVKLHVFSDTEGQALTSDYLWLRQCEQYLQAFGDEQTQTLPTDSVRQARLVALFECQDWSDFLDYLAQLNERIGDIFHHVVGEEEPSAQEKDDSAMQSWIDAWEETDESKLNEPSPHVMLAKQYRSDLTRSVSGARGRERLDALMPLLLNECHVQNVSEEGFFELLMLIKKIASRTTYLELLIENEGALSQLVKLTTSCQFIGQQISRFPLLLDQLIDPKLLYQMPQLDGYHDELRRQLLRVEPDDLETQMEVLRQFKLTNQLVVAACDIAGVATLMQVSDHLTAIAEACLEQATAIAWQQMVSRFGYPDGATDEAKNFAVIGYGKLGGYELGYGSDLDVVFVHGCDSNKATSGRKEIDSRQFYLKLAQRLLHLFTTRTLSGELYEVDTRLRPSGASGLLAINIETFLEYQQQEAWTWEHQALVRSRIVSGDPRLASRFAAIRQTILTASREQDRLQKDIVEMRVKMYDNLSKETDELFDLKQSRGGIADIEFISQYLVLYFSHKMPTLTEYSDNVRILQAANSVGLISDDEYQKLTNAYVEFRQHYHLASLNNAKKLLPVSGLVSLIEDVKMVWARFFNAND